jgi:spore germination protein
LARGYRVSLNDLIAANPQLTNPSQLSVGQVINIPAGTIKLGTIEVNGYAYPNISAGVLQSTLPYLTYLGIFSYQVREDGSLVSPNDMPLMLAARSAGVAPIMVITNIGPEGNFSSDLAHEVLTNTSVQDTLLGNI